MVGEKVVLKRQSNAFKDEHELGAKFGMVFKENRWGNEESVSGSGSALASPSVRDSIRVLDMIVRQFGIKTICDVPCGDFYWMPLVLGRFPKLEYLGFDIVPELITWNKERYPDRNFATADVCVDVLPAADLIFCKDLLLHLKNKYIGLALRNFKRSGSRFLLISSIEGAANEELVSEELGAYRHVDLVAEPYNFPERVWHDAYLSLWSLDAISLSFFDQLCNSTS
jgi:hypothetical protein